MSFHWGATCWKSIRQVLSRVTLFGKTESDAQGGLAGMYVKLRTESVENLFIWGRIAK